MDIGQILIIAAALFILPASTLLVFKQTRRIGTTFLRGFAPMFSVTLFFVLLYEVDTESPIPHMDNVIFALLVSLAVYAILRLIFRYIARIRNMLKKKFPNIGRLYSRI